MKKPDWKLWVDNMTECKSWLNLYIKNRILIKSSDESRLYLNKSDHNLIFANWLIEKQKNELKKLFKNEKFYDWIISIYYYAIYHSALALISKEGYKSKNHYATLCFLIYNNYHMQKNINTRDVEIVVGSLNKEDIQVIGFSKDLRERASYNINETFEEDLAQNIREQAVNFVNKIKFILK